MNKIIIPTLLIATVIAVGFFAFSPVEQASTVHAGATGVLGSTMITFELACAEIDLTADSDDGEIRLVVNGNNPVIVKAIYFESGGDATDINDTVLIADIRVDTVTLSQSNDASLSNITFDAAPTEGEIIANIDNSVTQNPGDLIANTDIGVTVDGTVNGDSTKYIVTFAGLRISSDTAPTCDVSGVT